MHLLTFLQMHAPDCAQAIVNPHTDLSRVFYLVLKTAYKNKTSSESN